MSVLILTADAARQLREGLATIAGKDSVDPERDDYAIVLECVRLAEGLGKLVPDFEKSDDSLEDMAAKLIPSLPWKTGLREAVAEAIRVGQMLGRTEIKAGEPIERPPSQTCPYQPTCAPIAAVVSHEVTEYNKQGQPAPTQTLPQYAELLPEAVLGGLGGMSLGPGYFVQRGEGIDRAEIVIDLLKRDDDGRILARGPSNGGEWYQVASDPANIPAGMPWWKLCKWVQ